MDQYSHLVHKRIPSRVLELVGAWHKKNPVSILTEYGTVRKMKIIFDLVSEAGPPGDILYVLMLKCHIYL